MSQPNERFLSFPVIATERLYLRPLSVNDKDDLFSFYQDRAFAQYLDWDGPSSIEECIDMISSWNRSYEENRLIPWGVELRDTGNLIGTVMFMPVRGTFDDLPRFPLTVSYDLKKDYWDKGLMTEALTAALEYITQNLGPHRIQAEVVPENTSSLKLLRKLGFQEEGVLRNYLMHEVTHLFLNVVVMALLLP